MLKYHGGENLNLATVEGNFEVDSNGIVKGITKTQEKKLAKYSAFELIEEKKEEVKEETKTKKPTQRKTTASKTTKKEEE